jgi:hypothetical protein
MKQITILVFVLLFANLLLAQTFGGPDTYGYTWRNSNDEIGPEYEWVEHSNPTEVTTLSDDSVSGVLPIGFSFTFYDIDYTDFYVQSNGMISFGSDYITLSNYEIPLADTYNNLIAWFWDDLDPAYPASESQTLYENITYNGQTVLLVSFIEYDEYPDGGNNITAQVILFPNGDIKMNYLGWTEGLDLLSSTIGIENVDGTDGLQYQFNQNLLEPEMALMFYHPLALDNDLVALDISGPNAITEGLESTFDVSIKNRGLVSQDTYSVILMDENDVELASVPGVLLEPNTEYTFNIPWTPDYFGDTHIYGMIEFAADEDPTNNITQNHPVHIYESGTTVVLSEGFETGALPEGWTEEFIFGAQSWDYFNGGQNSFPAGAHTGSYNARMYFTNATGRITKLVTPEMNIGAGEPGNLLFWHAQSFWIGQDELNIYYKTSVGGDWILLESFTEATPEWTQRSIDLPNPSTTYYVAFEGIGQYGYGVCVDDVVITGDPTNYDNDLTAISISGPLSTDEATTATFDVTLKNIGTTATENYTMRLFDDDDNELANAPGVMINPDEELVVSVDWMPTQVGDVTLRAFLDFASDQVPVNNYTGFTSIHIYPEGTEELINEGFEDGELPTGWTQEYISGMHDWAYIDGGNAGNPANAHTGSFNAHLYGGATGYTTILVSPEINIGMTDPAELRFWHAQADSWGSQDILNVYYKTSPGGEWELLESYTETVLVWEERVLELPNPATTYYIGFEGVISWGHGVCIDDVIVSGISDYVDNDLVAMSIEGPESTDAGTTITYDVGIKNMGIVAQSDYDIVLFDSDDNELASAPGILIDPGEELVIGVNWAPALPGDYNVYAVIDFENDEVPNNNTTSQLYIHVYMTGTEVIIAEDFAAFPPTGWSIEGGDNWQTGPNSNAGGTAPEAQFYWSPSTTAIQRMKTPPLNTVGATMLELEFRHLINDYNGDYELRIETSSDGVNWNTATTFPSVTIPATEELVTITTVDVGSPTFQVAWVFDGNSFNINYWYVDDVVLLGQLFTYDNDMSARTVTGPEVVNSGSSGVFDVTVKNVGLFDSAPYTVKLMREEGRNRDVELGSLDITEVLVPEEERTHSFVWDIPGEEPSGYTNLYGTVTMDGDENILNDQSLPFEVRIMEAGAYEITIGDGTLSDNRLPLCFAYNNSLTQTMYYPEEIGQMGTIQSVTYYNNFADDLMAESTKLWMCEYDSLDFFGGWAAPELFTQVFDGNIDYPSGQNAVVVNLDEPYIYQGGNLVIMAQRPWDDNAYPTTEYFLLDSTPEHLDRVVYNRDNVEEYDPMNPPDQYFVDDEFPNTTLFMIIGGLGSLEGYVYDNREPLEGVMIRLDGSAVFTYTDEDGFYQFANVPEGDQSFTASIFGYEEQSLDVEIIENETAELDFNLVPLGVVSVSGTIAGSDFPTEGLQGAIVSLLGYADYQTLTNASGGFTFPNVYANNTYEISAMFEGYESYTEEVIVEGVDVDLGTLLLTEIAAPPNNVQATQNDAGTEVELLWYSPGSGFGEFRYDDGEYSDNIGLGDTPENAIFGAVHTHDAIINEVTWYLTSDNGVHNQVKIFVFGLNGIGAPDQTDILYSSGYVTNTDDEWSSHVLPTPVETPNGFLVGISTPGEYTSIGYDDGVDEPWPFVDATQMLISDYTDAGEEWIDLGEYPFFENNLMIRALGVDLGEIDFRANSFNDAEDSAPKNNRQFEAYNVYRFDEDDHYNQDEWDIVATAVTDTFFTDTTWPSLVEGFYQFAITSVHTNDVESAPAFSAIVEKTTLADSPADLIPMVTALNGNYPNPFNPVTTINYQLSSPSDTELIIYNLKGQKIRTLVDDYRDAGMKSAQWNGKDDSGRDVSSGVYFYRLSAGKYNKTMKMILMK